MMHGDNTPKKQGLSAAWQSGQSGNPKGRPKGSRNKLSEAFVEDLFCDWSLHGPSVIERLRQESPDIYLRVIASLVPREMKVEANRFEDLTDDQLHAMIMALGEQIRADPGDIASALPETMQ